MDKLIIWFKERAPLIATLILLFAIPIYPKFPFQPVEGTYVAIRIDDFLVGGAILICLISQLIKGLPLLKSRVFKLILFYWLAGLIANLAAFGINGLVSVNLATFHWLRRIEYMSLFFLGYQAVNNKKDIRDIKLVVGVTFLAIFIFSLGQKYWHLPVISTMNEEFAKGQLLYLDKWTRISSTFGGHYDLAGWLVIFLALLPSVVADTKKWWHRAISFILGLLGLYLLILTASRVSFISYLLAISATLILLGKIKWLVVVLFISLLFGMSSKELSARLVTNIPKHDLIDKKVAYLTETLEGQQEKIYEQIKNISLKREKPDPTPEVSEEDGEEDGEEEIVEEKIDQKEQIIEPKEKIVKELRTWPTPEEAAAAAARSSNIRFEVEWPRAFRAFLKNPLTGTGYSSLGLATDNDYLRLLAETGIIGLASFMLVIVHLMLTFGKKIKNKSFNWKYAAGFIGAIIGILANAIYIDIFEASKVAFYFWMLMGIGYKIVNSKR